MKAFLLAAGLGSRLGALGRDLPKCLAPIGGRPLLDIWLEHLHRHGVEEVIANTHHLAEQIESFAAARNPPPHLHLAREEELLGTASSVLRQRRRLAGDGPFFVIYADNLSDVDLSAMKAFHRDHGAPFTMALFRSPEPEQCGIAACAADGRILEFTEKPRNPASDLANAGIYLMEPALLEEFPYRPGLDFGFDLLPALVGRMYGWEMDAYLCDIGTPERLRRAEKAWLARDGAFQGRP